jgi:chromosomal replication initiator protein
VFKRHAEACASPQTLGEYGGELDIKRTIVTMNKIASAYQKTRLSADLTFDRLVPGRANEFARTAGQQVSMNLARSCNPLYIYGGSGVGKTHLIHAIGNQIQDQKPDKIVRYVHAEDFYSDVVRSYQRKSFDVFKRYYRSLDVLLLDDVQFFDGKNRTQEEFFYLFNALIESEKQIVISCDTYPKEISGLEDRLVTRFCGGLTVQIQTPDIEMRSAILTKKAEAENMALDDDVTFYIAKHLCSNVRELEGAIHRIVAYAHIFSREINLEAVKDILSDTIPIID